MEFCPASVTGKTLSPKHLMEGQRDQILRLQFVAQRSGYRQQYPALVEQFILRDGRAIGWVMVSRDAMVRCVDLAILSEERRRGAATWALRELQAQAARMAVPLVLSVLRTNVPALALYDRLGFQPVGENDSHVFLEWRQVQASLI
jgi:ribosomal protein S18 acetylase RimI-like enzyme